jgi:hypothetical protein
MKMRARKGVTPVVATALLLSIAVGSVVTAGIFMDGTLKDLRGFFEGEIDGETGNPEIEIISAVEGTESDPDLVLDIRNTGEGPLDLTQGDGLSIVAGSSGLLNQDSEWSYDPDDPGVLDRGDTQTIKISDPGFPESGEDPVEIEISGPEGVEAGIICFPNEDQC